MEGFFKESVNSVVEHVKHLLSQPENQGVDTILMVGGFSESYLLSSAVRINFQKMNVVIPTETELAVLKGAVIFGHLPTIIRERKSKYTYGINSRTMFDPNIHDRRRLVVGEDGQDYCCDIFSQLVEAGQIMVVNEVQKERTYNPTKALQKSMCIDVYTSKEKNPLYVTDTGCKRIGKFELPLDGSGLGREVKVRAIFGGTEICFDCYEVATKRVKRLDIDFLSS